jgi:cytochrome c2
MNRKASIVVASLIFGLLDVAAAQTPAGDPARGKDIFEDRCTACHQLQAAGQGPALAGVVGRKAASQTGFAYSAALTSSGLTWTAANLDLFLSGPAKLVPGTAMFGTVSNPDKRRDLIAYLATQK